MAHFAGIKCDVCNNVKGSVNHWWVIYLYLQSVKTENVSYQVFPWSDLADAKSSDKTEVFHLCGIECKNKKINELDGKIINAINDARTTKVEELKEFVKAPKTPEGF